MKIIISTGQGRLHLIDSLRAIKRNVDDYRLITGWVPNNTPRYIVEYLGKVVGRKKGFYESMMKRSPSDIDSSKIKSCSFSEFLQQALFLLSNRGIISRENAAVIGWSVYGYCSKRHINNADIFHVRSGAGQGGAIRKARSKGMKIIVDHSIAHPAEVFKQLKKIESEENISITPDSKFWRMVLRDCNEADILLVNSEYVKQSFVDEGWDASAIEVIPLGVRDDFIKLKTDYSRSDMLKLLFTGSFSSRKGANILIEMTKILIDRNQKFELNIIGNIEKREALPNWFLKCEHIKFHGHLLQDELKKHFSENDIYIFPTYAEGAAQSVKEAMAAGMPVITTFNSGAPIISGESGILIPVHDVQSLISSLDLLGSNAELRQEMGIMASRVILKEHNWETYSERILGLFSENSSR
ncbi:glycosyltransferase family 4 protein [Vibrio cortegadensis]|uniref:glycosyltransferase family 4 protein n=1 Tax=Vibrio cortegadensis TaxID=1328770 RepID=UPI00352C9837